MHLDKINKLLDTYTALKIINKYKLKFKSKPWITLGLQKSISVKNKVPTNFINKKDTILKEELHAKYKKKKKKKKKFTLRPYEGKKTGLL